MRSQVTIRLHCSKCERELNIDTEKTKDMDGPSDAYTWGRGVAVDPCNVCFNEATAGIRSLRKSFERIDRVDDI